MEKKTPTVIQMKELVDKEVKRYCRCILYIQANKENYEHNNRNAKYQTVSCSWWWRLDHSTHVKTPQNDKNMKR